MHRILISITSVPQRINTTLKVVLQRFTGLDYRILVSVPKAYKKWGTCEIPGYLINNENVILYRPDVDYGPATKLLAALDYLRDIDPNGRLYDGVFTIDDDIDYIYIDQYIKTIDRYRKKYPDYVLTAGGFCLASPPYRHNNGLRYLGPLETEFVDIPQGYLGVFYPVKPHLKDDSLFNLKEKIPIDMFSDDDSYFGAALSRMNIPIFSIRIFSGYLETNQNLSIEYWEECESIVSRKTSTDRIDNQSNFFQYCVKMGYLPSENIKLKTQ